MKKHILFLFVLLASLQSFAQYKIPTDSLVIRGVNATGNITFGRANGNISALEFGYLDGLTSSIQTQLNLVNTPLESTYVISKNGSTITAYPTKDSGYSRFTGTSIYTILTSVMGQLTNGGVIKIIGSYDNMDIISVPYNNIIIQGEGKFKNTIKLKANADSWYNPLARQLKGMFEVHGISGFEIHDIGLDGNGQNQTWINNGTQLDGPGCLSAVYAGNQYVSATNSNNTVVENCYIHDFTMYGVYTNVNSYGAKVKDCLITDCYWNGITFFGNDDFAENVETYGSGDVGISIYGQRATLKNCYVGPQNGAYSSIASRWGLAVEQSGTVSKGHRIIDCIIDGGSSFALLRGFGVQNSEDVFIQNLKIRNSNNYGIYVEGSKDVTIINSSIKSTSAEFTQGIVIGDLSSTHSSNVKIINTDIDFVGFAINVLSGTDKTIIANNTLKSGSGDITDGGTSTTKANNFSVGGNSFIAETLTNKRIAPRIGTTTSNAAPAPNADTHDQYQVTALAVNATFAAPTGTPLNGQRLLIRVKDNGFTRTLA